MDILRILKAAPRKKNRGEAAMLYTPWGSSLATNEKSAMVRSEHPRPTQARHEILMLNGLWQCGITETQTDSLSTLNLDEVIVGMQAEYDREIVVPFSPESLLSRVNHVLQPQEVLWYKHSFTCGLPQGKRALLHFDGVDWACACKVDGVVVGTHKGAYDPFVFDITHELLASRAEDSLGTEQVIDTKHVMSHTIELCVVDPTDTGVQLRGKQKLESGGIWYTPQSGIWKSVWLEFVPEVYLERVTIEPDCRTNTVLIGCIAHKSDQVLREEIEGRTITVTLYEPTEHFVAPCDAWPDGTSVDKAQIDKAQSDNVQLDKMQLDKIQLDKMPASNKQLYVGQPNNACADNSWVGAELCSQSAVLTKDRFDDALGGYGLGACDQTMSFVLDVALEDAKRWSPEHPWIYPVKITFLDDVVWSYCAFRTAEIVADNQGVMRFYLNGEPYFVQGVLDQGYWSDGLMTAPADEALVYDIMAAKQAGFTMMRKHIKIEDDRWYYHCDRLGMLVWQDVPTGGGSYDMWSVNYKPTLWRRSWTHYRDDTVAHQIKLSSHDSDYQAEWIATATNMVRRLSIHPSIVTWVLFNEGWGQFSAAAMTELIHKEDPTRPIDATSGWFDQQVSDYNSVHNYFRDYEVYNDDSTKLSGYAAQRGGRAFVISEFGGVVYHDPTHSMYADFYGYDVADSFAAFRQAVVSQIASMGALEQSGLAGFVYTQLSDVEEETNGILTYDRKVNKLQSNHEL